MWWKKTRVRSTWTGMCTTIIDGWSGIQGGGEGGGGRIMAVEGCMIDRCIRPPLSSSRCKKRGQINENVSVTVALNGSVTNGSSLSKGTSPLIKKNWHPKQNLECPINFVSNLENEFFSQSATDPIPLKRAHPTGSHTTERPRYPAGELWHLTVVCTYDQANRHSQNSCYKVDLKWMRYI